jgi:predicted amidophosphoribosyltransferase
MSSFRPLGFPACAGCWYRRVWQPEVCLACFERSTAASFRDVGCSVCGQPLAGASCPNRLCGRADRGFSVVFPLGAYEGSLRRAIVAYKYRGQRWWAGVFARLLAGMLGGRAPWFEEFGLLVAVPSFSGPAARRRWDPVGAVASELAGRIPGWDTAREVLVKTTETPALTGLDRLDRRLTAESRLRAALDVASAGQVTGRRVLVLDDVFTEGATLREAAFALRAAGAEEVAGLVVARSVLRRSRPLA